MKKIILFVLATVMMLSMAISVSADVDASKRVYIYEKDANGQTTTNSVAAATYRIEYFSGTNCVRASSMVHYIGLHQSQYNFPAYIKLDVAVVGSPESGNYSQSNIGYITTQNGSINVDIYIPIGVVTGTVNASFETNKRYETTSQVYYSNGNFTDVKDTLSMIIP